VKANIQNKSLQANSTVLSQIFSFLASRPLSQATLYGESRATADLVQKVTWYKAIGIKMKKDVQQQR
jgi:alpha/beta superfamily hydrolase